jgi:glycosyltransferase involved in cell wall biosynthesis
LDCLVSIIVPVYNSEKYIGSLINSCLNQLELNRLEIIFIDDHSTDQSKKEILAYQKIYPKLIKYVLNSNRGANSARNLGFEISKGDYIQWLDSDDELFEGKFQKQLDFFKNYPNTDIVYSDWKLRTYYDDEIYIDELHLEKYTRDMLTKLLLDEWMPPHSYLLTRHAAEKINKYNGWNVLTESLQDREYYTIGALIGLNFGYVSGIYALYNRRLKEKSISKAPLDKKYKELKNQMTRLFDLGKQLEIDFSSSHHSIILSNLLCSAVILQEKFDRKIRFGDIRFKVFPGNKIKIFALIQAFRSFFNKK